MTPRLDRRLLVPVHKSVSTSQMVIEGRPSICLKLETERGVYRSEATPLTGFGEDDFGICERELSSLDLGELMEAVDRAVIAFGRRPSKPALGGGSESAEVWRWFLGTDAPVFVSEQLGERFSSPAARFCVESLVLGAAAGSCGVPLYRLLAANWVAPQLPVSAVVDGASDTAHQEVEALLREGVRHFKIKCGRNVERELSLIAFVGSLPSGPRIRLDPNGAFSVQTAVEFVQRTSLAPVDWIEDPTLDPREWPALAGQLEVPIALDQALSHLSLDEVQASGARIVVIKPMTLGGMGASLRLAVAARERGLRVVISHLFDGPAAFDAYAHLAFSVQSPELAPGLGPHAALAGYAALGERPPRVLRGNHLTVLDT